MDSENMAVKTDDELISIYDGIMDLVKRLQDVPERSRELSLVITKVEESLLWLGVVLSKRNITSEYLILDRKKV